MIKHMYRDQLLEGSTNQVRQRYTKCPHQVRSLPVDEAKEIEIEFTNVKYLSNFLNDRGMILPRRLTGLSAKFQRRLAKTIRKARFMGFLPHMTKLLIVDKEKVK